MLVRASFEPPGFSTLDEMAGRIRREVNTAIFERVDGRIGLPDRVGLEDLLEVVGPGIPPPKSAETSLRPYTTAGLRAARPHPMV